MSKRLGRGLDALFQTLEVDEQDQVREIPLSELRPNPYQPRKVFDETALEELKLSIMEHGVIQPILVRRSIRGYDIIAGERRYRASLAADLKTIPAVERNFTEQEMMEIALIENVQREDLNPIEIAEAYDRIMQQFELTQEEMAKKMGKSRPLVANYLRLLNLPKKVKENVSRGTISMGHAKVLLSVENKKIQEELLDHILKEGLSVRKLEEKVKNLQQNSAKKLDKKTNESKKPKKDIYVKDVEERLMERLGTSVTIIPGRKKGKIEIDYFSQEDLERIIDLLDS